MKYTQIITMKQSITLPLRTLENLFSASNSKSDHIVHLLR